MSKSIYLKSSDLARAVEESKKAGTPTAEACGMFRTLAEHMLKGPKYWRYPIQDKEDMASAALEKCIKNIKNFDSAKGQSAFNYFTRCCEHAFWYWLKLHYRFINRRRDAALAFAQNVEQDFPALARFVRERFEHPERIGVNTVNEENSD